jgi:hypothetical protein
MGCGARPVPPVLSHHAPSWKQHCAPLLERSVHADARGVDRLVLPIDDDLRQCWRLAMHIVDAGRPIAPPPSCRALRVAEPHPSASWLATCRHFEAGAAPARPVVAKRTQPRERGVRVFRGIALIDSDHDGIPDFKDRCPDEAGDDSSTDGCPRGQSPEAVRLLDGTPATRAVALELDTLRLQAPAMPPYDLTPAAQGICAAVHDVIAHFSFAPNPTIPLALAQAWSSDHHRYDIAWPDESTITPVEDALRGCLGEWSLDIVTTSDRRLLRWQKAQFLIELHTAPERRMSIVTTTP